MKTKNKATAWSGLVGILILLLVSACGQTSSTPTQNPTSTPTTVIMEAPPTPTTPPSPCGGLAGELEVQVLVGPAEAVGLEPVSVGNIPFAVTTDQQPYYVEGSGGLGYSDMLVQEWGTYEVTMDMSVAVSGECIDNGQTGQLDLVMELVGSQLVVVEAEGFSGEYPWEGTQTRDLAFPLEEGASAEGEGWAVILHLK